MIASYGGDVWEKQNGLGHVRPHEHGLVWLGFIVPALNWNMPCTCSARKNDEILPRSSEARRATA